MSEADFERSLAIVLREEGGNVDDPHDPGGRTSRGVTQKRYNAYRKKRGLPIQDVYKATGAEVRDIYRTGYWLPVCPKLPEGVDLVYFNIAVNAGPDRAARLLQQAIGGVQVDGEVGQYTFDKLAEHVDTTALVRAYCDKLRAYYRALRNFKRYGKGWLTRTDRVQKTALAMAAGTHVAHNPEVTHHKLDEPSHAPGQSETHNPAAIAHPDDKAEPPIMSPETGVVVTTGGGAVVATINETKDALAPVAGSLDWIGYVVAALTVVALAITVWGILHRRKVQKAVA